MRFFFNFSFQRTYIYVLVNWVVKMKINKKKLKKSRLEVVIKFLFFKDVEGNMLYKNSLAFTCSMQILKP